MIATILFLLVAILPGALHLLYRADAQVALGNAKSVRLALQTVAAESYGMGQPFGDASCTGGVTEAVMQDTLLLAKVPGDFWVLQVDESGYEVLRFLYQEGDFTVFYEAQPSPTYEVYHQRVYIQTQYPGKDRAS